jgi:hypothetical protein
LDLVVSRIENPAVLIWLAIALVGFAASLGTLLLMRFEIALHPMALAVPAVAAMKNHNMGSEIARISAQVIAFIVGVGFIAGWLSPEVVAWALVAMNFILCANSVNEFVLSIRLLGGLETH